MNKTLLAVAVMCLASDLRAWETVSRPCPTPPLAATIESSEAWTALWTAEPAPEFDATRETITVAAEGGDCTYTKTAKASNGAPSFMLRQDNSGFQRMQNQLSTFQGTDFDGAGVRTIQPLTVTGGDKKKDRLYRVKDYILPATAMFASGFLDGTVETISHHYESGFKKRFPDANDAYWNPEQSWRNKYKNGDPAQGPKFAGSTNMFVFTTDAYHSLRAGKRAIDMFTVVHYINDAKNSKMTRKQRITKTLIDAVILTAVRNIGFHASYSMMFATK